MRIAKAPSILETVAISALLMATVALSIDVLLPALGLMATELGVDAGNSRQLIITFVFLGLAAGQLVFGPLSDSIGRRPAIAIGVGLFALGGLTCALAQSFEMLLAGRFLQGIGAAGPRLVTTAMIRDRFSGREMARIMSFVIGIFILVPVIGPSIGQALLLFLPWRGLFNLLSVVTVLGVVWLYMRQPETLVTPRPFRLTPILRAFVEVLRDRFAMAYSFASGLCYGAIMGYVNSSQQVFQEFYSAGALYSVLFGIGGAFIALATISNSRLLNYFGMEQICRAAMLLLVALSLGFLALLFNTPQPPLWQFMAFTALAMFFLGLTFGNIQAIALENLGHIAGLATAIFATISTLSGMGVASIIGLNFNMTLFPIIFGYLGAGVFAYLLMVWVAPSAKLGAEV